jgi:hypothetical protein
MMVPRSESSPQDIFEAFIQLEEQSCDLLKRAYALEHQLDSALSPLVQRRKAELQRLQGRLAAADDEQQHTGRMKELERDNAESRQHIETLTAALARAEGMLAELEGRRRRGWRRYFSPYRASRQRK